MTERLFHVFLGLSVLSWAPLGMLGSPVEDRWTAVRLTLTAMHLVVGVLFMTRHRLKGAIQPRAFLVAAPSMVATGLAYRLAAAPHLWPLASSTVFALAGAAALLSLLVLGRSFALLPSQRDLVTSGPYGVVRHPAYLAELIMLAAACSAVVGGHHPAVAVAVLALGISGVGMRIVDEERLLSREATWNEYVARVRWRLIPGLW